VTWGGLVPFAGVVGDKGRHTGPKSPKTPPRDPGDADAAPTPFSTAQLTLACLAGRANWPTHSAVQRDDSVVERLDVQLEQRPHHGRVELAPGLRRDLGQRPVALPGLLVGPLVGQRVEHVGH
jgi:hypothetical protein